MSKKEFIQSKFITVVVFAGISTLFIFIVSLILGLIYSSFNEVSIIFSDLEYLLAYFVKLVGFFSFCLFLGILIKRSAFALGFLLFWNIIEGIIIGVLNFSIFPDDDTDRMFTQFLPLESMSNLLVEPITRLKIVKSIGDQVGIENLKDYGVHPLGITIVLVWTAIFIFLSYKIIKRRDL
jgi:ABC-type transport system involved in multi-copper enzyme maturation permease subunit